MYVAGAPELGVEAGRQLRGDLRVADRIFVLPASGVVEQGSHAALIAADGRDAATSHDQARGQA